MKKIFGLVGWLLLSFVAAAVGALASIQARTFYELQAKPDWAPPAGIFGPAWTVLYAMMGIAAWLVWRRGGWAAQRLPLMLFVAQLVLNAAWSWLFFVWRIGGAAFGDIVLLWLLIAATLACFWRVRMVAGALLIPYLAWVGFAAALNYSLWRLNPQTLGWHLG
jgi:translocator protein